MTAFKIKLWITLFSTSRLRISDTPKQKNQNQTKSPKCAQSEEITFTFLDPSSVSFQIFECAYERKRKCMLKPVWFVNSTWLNKNMIIKEQKLLIYHLWSGNFEKKQPNLVHFLPLSQVKRFLDQSSLFAPEEQKRRLI